ncbi:putative Type 1 protein exporter [Helianthus annuus]|nr:putative ABC transporter, P-loop containing nucleoside triphosphate hydrolase [Helianthus annuus]KAJ0691011.1 putative Type 1 protein exporter [Helianthus annuus]
MLCINKSCARTWALINPCRNGSGKSSIIPLMEWFYNPTLGEAHLDGKNIKNLKIEWLRSQIELVTQEPALLSQPGTILFMAEMPHCYKLKMLLKLLMHILLSPQSRRDMIHSGILMRLLSFFKLKIFYLFMILNKTAILLFSGRQGWFIVDRREVNKAFRCYGSALNPSILLLDEVTSGLDFEAERSVWEALDVLTIR